MSEAPKPTISVFIGISVDGFIARLNGALDFLPPGGGEPHGYTEFMAGIDTLVIGRGTYETVATFPEWPYGDKRVVVLSSTPIDLSKAHVDPDGRTTRQIEHLSGTPDEIVVQLAATGTRQIYVDGGVTVRRFLRAGLIDRLITTRVPVLIGQGIPLFGTLPHDIHLRHVSTKSYTSGLVSTEYQVLR
jgi:dihydrofolate reductase